jgi:hypothetical protein
VIRLSTRSRCVSVSHVFLSIILILLGLTGPATASPPLFSVVRQNAVPSLIVGALLVFTTFCALLIARLPDQPPGAALGRTSSGARLPGIAVSAGISTVSTLLFAALLFTVLIRPSWCPMALCPAPQTVTSQGIHDQRLDVYAIALQSGAFAISDTTSTYTQDNLPRTTGAVRFDQISRPTSLSQPTSLSPYLLVIGVHNLTQSAYPLIVEHVGIIVREKSPCSLPQKCLHLMG